MLAQHKPDVKNTQQARLTCALVSRQQVDQGELVLDGPTFACYLRSRVRCASAARPIGKSLAGFAAEKKESD